MDFIERLRELSQQITRMLEHIKTEEATKTALIMPFIGVLGYNVFDPTEVVPEFICDVGTKKGEKVDYAIMRDGKPIMLIECKPYNANLDEVHASQLYRYFTVTSARFGILTNGLVYRFYTDLETPNIMDSKPFFEFHMLDIREPLAEELKKFTKSAFNVDVILTTAAELKYTREIKRLIADQMKNPTDEFVRLFTSQVYTGRMTQQVKDQFSQLIRQAWAQYINEQFNDRIKVALSQEPQPEVSAIAVEAASETLNSVEKVVTTQEEVDAFLVVKAILREIVDVSRLTLRDTQSYCSVLLDDNNRKPICRLHFGSARKQVEFLNEQKQGERVVIEKIDDLYKLAERFRTAAYMYIKPASEMAGV